MSGPTGEAGRAPGLLLRVLGAVAALGAFAPHARSAEAARPVKVIYHFTQGLEEATRGLQNIRNHLKADPSAKIVVVANGDGIDFLVDGARDKHGNPYDAIVEDLVSQGVEFRVCHNTITTRKIDPSKILPEAKVVPSGVAEVARLESREGFGYLRP